jgi:hypothetical protein
MTRFDRCISYEDRTRVHTRHWSLEGVSTADGGPTDRGWLWASATLAAGEVSLGVYDDPAAGPGHLLASGTATVAGELPVRCTLSAEGSATVAGEVWIKECSASAGPWPLLASLCVDADLAEQYRRLSELPVYSSSFGLARYCAAGARRVLDAAVRLLPDELGGAGAIADSQRTSAGTDPDLRRLIAPDQLRSAAVHAALAAAFGACHDIGGPTLYQELRDGHEQRYRRAVAAWRLTLAESADTDAPARTVAPAAVRRARRI